MVDTVCLDATGLPAVRVPRSRRLAVLVLLAVAFAAMALRFLPIGAIAEAPRALPPHGQTSLSASTASVTGTPIAADAAVDRTARAVSLGLHSSAVANAEVVLAGSPVIVGWGGERAAPVGFETVGLPTDRWSWSSRGPPANQPRPLAAV